MLLLIQCTKHKEADNLTIGQPNKEGLSAILGTILEAEGSVRTTKGVRNYNELIKNCAMTATVLLPQAIKDQILDVAAEYFETNHNKNPYVQLQFVVDSLSGVTPGVHPETGEPTFNMIGTALEFQSLETSAEIINLDLLEMAHEAQEVNKTKGLIEHHLKKAEKAGGTTIKERIKASLFG